MNVFDQKILVPENVLTKEQFISLTKKKKVEYLDAMLQLQATNARRNILTWFPDTGPYRRELYKKHVEFFDAGKTYKERLFIAANRTGKSLAASFEISCHATGMYPDWWTGYKFTRPVRIWASSKTSTMTRDFVQRYLTGPWGHFGTGMIPGDCFTEKDWTPKRGIPEAVDVLRVHGQFGESEIGFKSYDQGWQSYQGTAQDVIWNDEECDELVQNECLTRLMTTKGIYMLTFTPLQGLTKVVRAYLGESLKIENKSKFAYVVNCTWDDVPHLSKEEKAHQWERTPPHIRDAKSKGIPSIGSGSIYPVPESDLKVSPFKIPDYWPRAFGMDVGWNRTAALWGALDRENDILYLYSEYYRGQAEPSVHADGIKARGSWIPGVIDPASRGRNQKDGTQLFQIYTDLGLDIEKSKNAVEAGIAEVWQRMSSGRIKIFSTLQNLFTEIRMYHRDENGKIVKEDDHLLDCLHPDTIVITSHGRKRIVDLVGKTGQVLGYGCKWVDFKNCRLTRKQQQIVEVVFASGSVKCTADHKFLTPEGWVEAKHMAGKECYNTLKELRFVGEDIARRLYQKGSNHSLEKPTGSAGSIFRGMASASTERSTSSIVAKFLKDIASTILTKINPTTTSRTLSCEPKATICPIITKGNMWNYLKTQDAQPQSGTEAKKGCLGICSTMRMLKQKCTRRLSAFVNNAARYTSQLLARIDFVPQVAGQSIGSPLGLITRQEFVSAAEKSLHATSMSKKERVQGHAVELCLGLRELGVADTYCMEVPDGNAFSVEGGVIVHNCLKYLVLSGLSRATTRSEIETENTGQVNPYTAVDSITGY